MDAARDAALEWFTKLQDSQLSDAERAAFIRWRDLDKAHEAAYAELESVWKELDAVPAPAPAKLPPRWWLRFGTPVGVRVAAAAALVLWVMGLMFAPAAGYRALVADARTGVDETRSLTLPDGSHAMVDAGSALSFDISDHERRVTLVTGRAFFTVKHEKTRPFIVDVGTVQVRDIGTAFEVSRNGSKGQVSVAEGVVELAANGGGTATLGAGDSMRFDKSLGAREPVAIADVAAWRGGRLIFIDAPVEEVLADLQRYGAGRVVVLDEEVRERRITGAFDVHAPREALASVLALAGAPAWSVGSLTIVHAGR